MLVDFPLPLSEIKSVLDEDTEDEKPDLALDAALMILTGDVQRGFVTSSISFVILEGVVFLLMISLASSEEWMIFIS